MMRRRLLFVIIVLVLLVLAVLWPRYFATRDLGNDQPAPAQVPPTPDG